MKKKKQTNKKVVEIFKDVYGFQGQYLVSNYGNIYSLKRNIFLRKQVDKYGYEYVQLSSKKITAPYKTCKVHRLVFEAFVRPLVQNEDVNHIDRNKLNNKLSNLSAMDHRIHVSMHKKGCIVSKQTKRKISETKRANKIRRMALENIEKRGCL